MQYTLLEANRESEERAAQIATLRAQVAQLTADNESIRAHWTVERDAVAQLESQVAQLTLERDGCRDLIATLRTKLADAEATAWELRSNKEASDGK